MRASVATDDADRSSGHIGAGGAGGGNSGQQTTSSRATTATTSPAAAGAAAAAATNSGSRRSLVRRSTSFFPFSSSVRSVDDAPPPLGARPNHRMCRPQRIRPSSCCVEFVHSHHYHHPPHNRTVDSTTHYCNCHFRCCHRHRSSSAMANADSGQPALPPLPAPPTITVETDEQKPRRRTLWQALRKNCHWKCFVLTLMIDGCLAIIFWCQWTQRSYLGSGGSTHGTTYDSRKSACEQGYNFIPVAFAVMLYVVYIMECWHCRTRLDLLCKTDIQSVYDYVAQLRESSPVVWWRAVCYHYVRRTRQVTRYRNGDAVTSTQVYYERINSHTAGSAFMYQDCGKKDISKKLVDLNRFPVTRIRFRKGFVFANLQAANEFEEQRARFFQENEQRDDYMEVREGLDLIHVTFKENMVAFADPSHRPWFIAQPTFWLCSLLMLSWPLRVLIEYRTAYVNYQVTKLFGTNYLSPSSQNYTGPLTRVSTMDSGDLEAVLRNSYVVVPSYSEALLMDPVQGRTAITTGNGSIHIQTRPTAVRIPLEMEGGGTGSRFALPSPRRLMMNGNGTNDAILNNERVITNYGALMNEARTSGGGWRNGGPVVDGHRFVGRGRSVHPDTGMIAPAGPCGGGAHTDLSPLQQFLASAHQRSQSLGYLLFRTRSSSDTARRNAPANGPPHSISFGSIAAMARANIRRPYRTLPATPDVDGATEALVPHHHHHDPHDDHISEAPEEPPPPYDLALKLCQPVITSAVPSGAGSRFKWFANHGSTAVGAPAATQSPAPAGDIPGEDAEAKDDDASHNGDDTLL